MIRRKERGRVLPDRNRRPLRLAAFVVSGLLLATSPALAAVKGKGQSAGGGSGESLTLVPLNATPGAPYFGDQVTFTVSTNSTDSPWVNVNCYQAGTWVYGQWQGFFASYAYGQTFTLGPTNLWQGGSADCTAALVSRDNNHPKTLAKISFQVAT